jgi:GDP-L-fucose synthase
LLHSEDAADACIFLLRLSEEDFDSLAGTNDIAPLVNIGCGEDLTVRELAELVAEVVGISPSFSFDPSKPDGTPRKLLDTRRLAALGWRPRIGLREGLRQTYADFCSQLKEAQPGPRRSMSPCVF